jgi:cytochrome c oxidase subunit 2
MRLAFQDPATAIMEGIIDLHHSIFFYLIIVLTLVIWMLLYIVREYGIALNLGDVSAEKALVNRKIVQETRDITHGTVIEVVWTVIPALILVVIAIPTFSLLYSMDELIEPTLTIKAVGHQWYWSYEYSDFDEGDIAFDSYMVKEDELSEGDLRLLEVDRKVWLPTNTHVRVVITATDVIHCWALPSLGVKLDAIPGRLNQTSMFLKREGLFYGQCSEICGVEHGFMPICIKAVPVELFNSWVDFNLKG